MRRRPEGSPTAGVIPFEAGTPQEAATPGDLPPWSAGGEGTPAAGATGRRSGGTGSAGGALASGRALRWVVAALLFVTISRVHDYVGVAGLVRPGLLLMTLALGVVFLHPGSIRIDNLVRSWPAQAILVLAAIMGVSALVGLSFGASASFLLGTFSRVFLLFALIVVLVDRVEHLRGLMTAYVASSVALVLFVLGFGGLDTGSGFARVAGTAMYDGNDLGAVLLVGFPLSLLLVQVGGRFERLLGWAGFVLIPVLLLLTGSRGAFLGLAFSALVLLILAPGIPMLRKGMFLALSVGAAALFAPPAYWDQIGTILNPTADYNLTDDTGRIAIWTRGLGYVAENPILGVGPDNFIRAGWILSDVARGLAGRGLRDLAPHNSFIQVWAELGTAGLLVWIALIVGGCWSCLSLRRTFLRPGFAAHPQGRFLFLVASYLPVAYIGFSVSAFFTSHAYTAMFYVLAAYLAGFLMVSGRIGEEVASGPPHSPGEPPREGPVGEGDGRDRFVFSDPDWNRWEGGALPLPRALSRGPDRENAPLGAAPSLQRGRAEPGSRSRLDAAGPPDFEGRRATGGEPGGSG